MKNKVDMFWLILIFPLLCMAQVESFHSNLKKNCRFCHVVDSNSNTNFTLVWQQSTKDIFYIPYKSSTLDAEVSQPMGSSKLCLSCHDGILAFDNTGFHKLEPNQILGTNLSDSHPVSFKYDSFLAMKDRGLFDPVSTPSGLGGTIDSDMLVNGNLECISCHDIHGFSKVDNYLIKSNRKSQLCLTCHNK